MKLIAKPELDKAIGYPWATSLWRFAETILQSHTKNIPTIRGKDRWSTAYRTHSLIMLLDSDVCKKGNMHYRNKEEIKKKLNSLLK